jgi:hypothetical protein
MADFIKTDMEAKQLVCPQMSTPKETVHCLSSSCAMWCWERAFRIRRMSHIEAGELSLNDALREFEDNSGTTLDEEQAEAFAVAYAKKFDGEPERPASVPAHWIWEYHFDPEEPWEFWCGWRESEQDALQRDRDSVKGWCGLICAEKEVR